MKQDGPRWGACAWPGTTEEWMIGLQNPVSKKQWEAVLGARRRDGGWGLQ